MADENDVWTFRLTVVRHGETSENRNRIIQGQMDTLLNEEGNEQVRLVSKRLKCENFVRVLSSDLKRTLQTAEGICLWNKFLQDFKIEHEPLLRERSYGIAEGRSCTDFKRLYSQGKIPEGAETCQDVDNRAKIFFERLLEDLDRSRKQRCTDDGPENADKREMNVLVVSHGGWIRSLVKHFAKHLPCSHFPLEKNKLTHQICSNTGVSVFEVSLNGREIKDLECLQFYDKSHLN